MSKKISVTRKQYNLIKNIYRFGGFFLILGLLIFYSFCIGKPIEFLLIFTPYFITKGFYTRQWHATSLKQCFIISFGIFALLTTMTMNKSFSLLFSFTIGLVTALVSYKCGIIQLKLKDYEYIEPRYNQLVEWYSEESKIEIFNIDTCTFEELLERCRTLAVPIYKANDIYDLFNMDINEYMEKNQIEYQSVCNKRQRYRNKFNTKS